jgi:DNA-binding transcriptional ArsR family regulator
VEQQLASLFSTLSDGNRIRIIRLLWERPRTVTELADAMDMQISAVSHQLSRLRAYEIVTCSREGRQRVYSLKMASILCVLYHMSERGGSEVCVHGIRYDACARLKEGLHD